MTPAERRARLEQLLRGRSPLESASAPTLVRETSFAQDRRGEILRRKLSVIDRWVSVHPYFKTHETVTRATTRIDGREYLSFSTYNYLSLSGHPRVSAAAKDAIDRYGTSPSASRVASGDKLIHRELESEIATLLGTEAALVFVGGHATNVSTIGYLCTRDDVVLYDAWAHNSIVQGIQLSGARARPFRHNDLVHLSELLGGYTQGARRVLIVTEGVFSMDGDIPDLPGLVELKRRHGAMLMVDEAHSIGVLGATGAGIGEHFGVNRTEVDVWMGTLSKSFASCGGYIAGSTSLIHFLKYSVPGFLYSVGITPANAGAALAAIRVLREEPERVQRLRRNCTLFLELAREAGLDTGVAAGAAVIPVITGSSYRAVKLADALFERGVNVEPMISPAVEQDRARLRFFITAEHTEDDLRNVAALLASETDLLPRRRTLLGERLPTLPSADPMNLPIFHVTDPESIIPNRRLVCVETSELAGFDPTAQASRLAIVRALCADLAAGDLSRMGTLGINEGEVIVPGPSGLPIVGHWHGSDALLRYVAHRGAIARTTRIEARYAVAHGKSVLVAGPRTSVMVGTGERVEDAFLFRFTFGPSSDCKETRITRMEEVVDPTPWLAALPRTTNEDLPTTTAHSVRHDSNRAARLRDIVQDLYNQFIRKGDIEAFARVCDEDVVWEIDGPRALFFSGCWRGASGVIEFWSELATRMDVHSHWIDHILVRGDEVFVVGGFRSTANASGLAYSDPLIHVFRFRGEQVIGFHEYFDPRITLAAYRPDLVKIDA